MMIKAKDVLPDDRIVLDGRTIEVRRLRSCDAWPGMRFVAEAGTDAWFSVREDADIALAHRGAEGANDPRCLHEISLQLDNHMLRFNFLATLAQGEAIQAVFHRLFGDGLQDPLVFAVDPDPDCATALLDCVLKEVASAEDEDTDLRAMATSIDAAVARGGPMRALTVEYIWDNGGGEDNPFCQSFLAPHDAEAEAMAFTDRLFAAIGDAIYDEQIMIGTEGRHPDRIEGAIRNAATALLPPRDGCGPGSKGAADWQAIDELCASLLTAHERARIARLDALG